MRAQLRAFESHLAQTVARMGSLLEMVDSREHAVQELLVKSMDGVDFDLGSQKESERDKEKGGDRDDKGQEKEKRLGLSAS